MYEANLNGSGSVPHVIFYLHYHMGVRALSSNLSQRSDVGHIRSKGTITVHLPILVGSGCTASRSVLVNNSKSAVQLNESVWSACNLHLLLPTHADSIEYERNLYVIRLWRV